MPARPAPGRPVPGRGGPGDAAASLRQPARPCRTVAHGRCADRTAPRRARAHPRGGRARVARPAGFVCCFQERITAHGWRASPTAPSAHCRPWACAPWRPGLLRRRRRPRAHPQPCGRRGRRGGSVRGVRSRFGAGHRPRRAGGSCSSWPRRSMRLARCSSPNALQSLPARAACPPGPGPHRAATCPLLTRSHCLRGGAETAQVGRKYGRGWAEIREFHSVAQDSPGHLARALASAAGRGMHKTARMWAHKLAGHSRPRARAACWRCS
jgi:hypothetical protein